MALALDQQVKQDLPAMFAKQAPTLPIAAHSAPPEVVEAVAKAIDHILQHPPPQENTRPSRGAI